MTSFNFLSFARIRVLQIVDVVSVEQFEICFWWSERGLPTVDREDTDCWVEIFFVVVEGVQQRNKTVSWNKINHKNHRLSSERCSRNSS